MTGDHVELSPRGYCGSPVPEREVENGEERDHTEVRVCSTGEDHRSTAVVTVGYRRVQV